MPRVTPDEQRLAQRVGQLQKQLSDMRIRVLKAQFDRETDPGVKQHLGQELTLQRLVKLNQTGRE